MNNIKMLFTLLGMVAMGLAYSTSSSVSVAAEGHMEMNGVPRMWVSLADNWEFRTGKKSDASEGQWERQVLLPGSLDENQFGEKDPGGARWLTRMHSYIGPALYQRNVTIPKTWKDKHIELFLEQCHLRSEVWVDNKAVGNSQNSMTVPHVYDLSDYLSPGTHTLTIAVDNKDMFSTYRSAEDLPLMGNTTSRHTQTNWNGITGKIELRAADKIWVKRVRIFPNVQDQAARVELIVYNAIDETAEGSIRMFASSFNSERFHQTEHIVALQEFRPGVNECTVQLPMGEDVQLWDEFHPSLYELRVILQADAEGGHYADDMTQSFGMCDFTTDGTQFSVNGRKTFLRGTEDAAAFPITGHPPMDVDSWLKIFRTCKSYGINHMRFHSWCPPEAAFEAADLVGVYLQPEGPTGGKITMPVPEDDYVTKEMMRIQNAFGNHPSLVMMSIGNELNTSFEEAGEVIRRLKENDPRQLHAAGSNPVWNRMPGGPVLPGVEDYFVAMNTSGYDGSKDGYAKGPLRGAFHIPSAGYLENKPPSTNTDYSDSIQHIDIPALGHEVGQHAMYPNYAERIKYTGVLKSENFDLFLKKLQDADMGDQAQEFFLSSGKWSTLLYKEEVEAALRTRGFGGFRLLDLHDYPGQNTALVGILDVFYDSKGLIQPYEWREFCSPVVPLVRMNKLTWTTDETLEGNVQIANYGEDAIHETVTWTLKDRNGEVLAQGKLADLSIPQGDVSTVGKLSIPLDKIPAPSQLELQAVIENTNYRNHWEVWVYPEDVDTMIPKDVVMTKQWSEARQALSKGKKVLFQYLDADSDNSVPGSQSTLFWSYGYFKSFGPAGTLGILCDPKHPALAEFPTEFHQNWQWADILKHSRSLVLDFTPPDFRPIVQIVDNKFRNHKLGNLLEARVDKGSLLVCSMDISTELDKRPVARQMLGSLLTYMSSEAFQPDQRLEFSLIDEHWGE